jgi:hypothetical protein
MARKKVLFVAYGGGHAHMVIPVARALLNGDWATPVVLGLTSAADLVRAAGLPLLQFKDFLDPGDQEARRWGEQLLAGMTGATIDPDESVAYLGLSFHELVRRVGENEALRQYAVKGRHCFLPIDVLERILDRVKPDLVVSTSAPRAEHAAFLAARRLGIPSVCLIDTFIQDDAMRLGAPGYADAICVLNESVKQVLTAVGARAGAVHCTGNPAFDVLQDPATAEAGRALRERMAWAGKKVVLLPVQKFQPYHPLTGGWPGFELPRRLEAGLVQWVRHQGNAVLCIRPRPDDPAPKTPAGANIIETGREWPLAPLLHAVDIVVTICSTVGLEGYITGARVIQILGTPFDDSTPWLKFGVADRAVELDQLVPALEELGRLPRRGGRDVPLATPRIVQVLRGLAA